MNKKIIFRADGNSKIGLGHLFRIFALIEIYQDVYDIILLTKQGTVLDVIPEKYAIDIIPNTINYNNEPYWIAKKYSSSEYIIIADGYQFDSIYQKTIKQQGFFLIYVDDLATEHMFADIVINHAPHVKKENFDSETYTKFALGTDYAMLRPLFLQMAKKERQIDKVDTAFVCFGGSDIYDLSNKAVQALLYFDIFKEINVVLGGAYDNSEIFSLSDERLKLHKNLNESEMVNLMSKCNFGVVPSSTILYEICSIKMPVMVGYYVDNQESIYHSMNEKNVFYPLGDIEKFTSEDFERHFENIQKINVQSMLRNQKVTIDGGSKQRFLDLLKNN